jgi:hypothetical protein
MNIIPSPLHHKYTEYRSQSLLTYVVCILELETATDLINDLDQR